MTRLIFSIAGSAVALALLAGTAAASGGSADLGVSVAADSTSVKVGDLVTYKITVTNHGESAADSARVADLLPAGLQLVSVEGASSDTWSTTAVAAGKLVRDPNDNTSDTAAAGRNAEGAAYDLGYTVVDEAGRSVVTVAVAGPIANIADGSTAEATRTVTIVARATKSGKLTSVVSVDSTTNPDPNVTGNNYALAEVTAA